MDLNVAQVMERNLTLAERHFLDVIDHPEVLEGLPEDAHVIFLPANDPELLEANLGIANQLARSLGHNGSRRPVVLLLLLPAEEADTPHASLVYDLEEPSYVRLREDDRDESLS